MQQKKEINVIIGANIKQIREKHGLTQEQLSEMMGIGVKSLSAIERGVVGISLTQLKNVCEMLGESSDALIFGNSSNVDARDMTRRLERLTPEQYHIADSIYDKAVGSVSSEGLKAGDDILNTRKSELGNRNIVGQRVTEMRNKQESNSIRVCFKMPEAHFRRLWLHFCVDFP